MDVYRADDDGHAVGLALTDSRRSLTAVGQGEEHGQAFRRFKESLRRAPWRSSQGPVNLIALRLSYE